MKNLDELVNLLSEAKFDLFAYEKNRQNRIQLQIEKLKKEKPEGYQKEIQKLEKELESSGLAKNLGINDNKYKDAGTDNVEIIKKINIKKGEIWKLMIEYANATGGVGDRANVSKWYSSLNTAVEQLVKYEDGYYDGDKEDSKFIPGAPRRYFDQKKNIGRKLQDIMKKISPDKLDWEEQEIPFTSDAPNKNITGTPEYIKRDNIQKQIKEIEDKLKSETDPTKKIDLRMKLSDLRKEFEKVEKLIDTGLNFSGKSDDNIKKSQEEFLLNKEKSRNVGKVIGEKRYNAFVYEALYPYIKLLREYNKKSGDIEDDLLSNNPTNKEVRRAKLKDILSKGDSEELNDKEFENFRKTEKELDSAEDAKYLSRDDNGKLDHSDYNALRYKQRTAERNTYANGKVSGNTGFLKAKNIEKMPKAVLEKDLFDWNKSEAKVDNEHKVILYGTMPGGQSGAGKLIFKYTDKPAENQLSIDGLYAFKVHKETFTPGAKNSLNHLNDYSKYIIKADKDFKNKVKKAIGMASAETEIKEECFFNY